MGEYFPQIRSSERGTELSLSHSLSPLAVLTPGHLSTTRDTPRTIDQHTDPGKSNIQGTRPRPTSTHPPRYADVS